MQRSGKDINYLWQLGKFVLRLTVLTPPLRDFVEGLVCGRFVTAQAAFAALQGQWHTSQQKGVDVDVFTQETWLSPSTVFTEEGIAEECHDLVSVV